MLNGTALEKEAEGLQTRYKTPLPECRPAAGRQEENRLLKVVEARRQETK